MKLTRRVLHNQAKPVDFQYPIRNNDLATQMFGLMRLQNGIGLAAPQIGQLKRMIAVFFEGGPKVFINPKKC